MFESGSLLMKKENYNRITNVIVVVIYY